MNIIMINQDATVPPFGYGGRSYFLFEEFNRIGIKTHLIKAKNTHLHRSSFVEETHPDITSLFTFKYENSKSYLRILNWFLFAFLLVIRAFYTKISGTRVDLVYYSSPSLVGAISGLAMARILKAKFVFEFRDIWPLTLVNVGGFNERNIGIKFMQKIEKFVVENAELVVSTLPGGKQYLEESGLKFRDFYHSPNGVNTVELDYALGTKGKLININRKKINLIYAGSLSEANAIVPLMKSVRRLKDRTDIHFHILGDGAEKKSLEILMNDSQNITFYGHFDKFSAIRSVAACDIALIAWHDLDIYRFGVSANKIFEYMALGLPIINIYSGGYDYVSRHKCGVTLESTHEIDLSDAIMMLNKANIREEFGQRGRSRVAECHTYKIIAKNLVTKIKNMR